MHSVSLSERDIDGMRLSKMWNPSSGQASMDRARYAPQILPDMQTLRERHSRYRSFHGEQCRGGVVIFFDVM